MNIPSIIPLTAAFVLGAVVFHWLEKWAPIYPTMRRGPGRRAYVADFTAAVVDGPVMSSLIKLLACWVIIQLPVLFEAITVWPWWLQFTVFFLVNDLGRYWLHRWHHTYPWLWRIHRVHHTAVEMDALTNFRVHVLEALIKYGVVVLPFHLVGIDKGVLLIYSMIDMLKGYWHHANLRTYIGPLNYLLNSAEQHWWHHSAEKGGRFANFGSVLSIWDILFGTFYWPRGRWPESVGVHNMERFPETYLGLLASVAITDEEAERRFHGGAAEPDKPVGSAASEPSVAEGRRSAASAVGVTAAPAGA